MTGVILLILAIWFVALFSGAPIYVLMALAGAAFAHVADINLIVIPQKFAKAADSFPLLAAPMYILMGNLMNSSGVTERIFRFATVCVGWWKGGLCHANIVSYLVLRLVPMKLRIFFLRERNYWQKLTLLTGIINTN